MNLNDNDLESELMTAVIVQGNFQKNLKQNNSPESILEKYLELTYSVPIKDADIIIFPETSIHSSVSQDSSLCSKLYKICDDFDSVLIFGSQYNYEDLHYNACMAINDNCNVTAAYIKRLLVPYGEYNPFKYAFPSLTTADFTAGNECSLIYGKAGTIGCSICFESTFANQVSESVKNGAEVLTVLTNDSWLGNYIPLYQHHSHSIMRAVESNRYVLTSANTGISSIVDNKGRILSKSYPNTECSLNGHYLLNNSITLYTRIGDAIILPSCFIIFFSCISFIFRQLLKF